MIYEEIYKKVQNINEQLIQVQQQLLQEIENQLWLKEIDLFLQDNTILIEREEKPIIQIQEEQENQKKLRRSSRKKKLTSETIYKNYICH